jgi:hypothetical protein
MRGNTEIKNYPKLESYLSDAVKIKSRKRATRKYITGVAILLL